MNPAMSHFPPGTGVPARFLLCRHSGHDSGSDTVCLEKTVYAESTNSLPIIIGDGFIFPKIKRERKEGEGKKKEVSSQ
jgi:hypothetical protein